jgi:NTP pyrophosphatase (non-canonical NTP hydrolase)
MRSETTLTTLRDALRRFADERDWNQYHSPKNLAISVSLEAAELLEHFQWTGEAAPGAKQEIAHEMADVLLYLVRLADRLDIDLLEAAARKMELNAIKYPVTTREIRK